jgi:pimeloyl-ACP methyl ester carboxylesterase
LRAFFSLAIFCIAVPAAAGPEHVSLNTGAGRLQGIRDLPEGKPPFTCALIIAGSGPTDRDGNQPTQRNDSLKQLGEALARRGVCALRYDKRGVGASAAAGVPDEDLFDALVWDAAGWLHWLRRNSRVQRVAVIGHGEGALIALLAAKLEGVEALVTIAGPGRPAPGAKHDPAVEIASVEAPVLVMHGTADRQVPVAEAWLLSAARPAARLRLIPDMNHVLKHAADTDPSIPIEPRAIDVLVDFLLKP